MRNLVVLLAATSLAACGGGGSEGPEALGGSAAPVGPGGASGSGYEQFVNPTEARTYTGVGAYQVYEYLTDERVCCEQQAQIFAPAISTVRDSSISIAYDPREAVFTLSVDDPRSGAATRTRFQDPAHRTDFGGDVEPQWGVDDFGVKPDGTAGNSAIRFLQAGDGDARSPYRYSGEGTIWPGTNDTPADGMPGSSYTATNLFYEQPGTNTRYVGYAGFVRNSITFTEQPVLDADGEPVVDENGEALTSMIDTWHLERGAFAYGMLTANSAVPTSGAATYRGNMLGSVVYNPLLEVNDRAPTYFQWMTGTAEHRVDFGSLNISSTFVGRLYEPHIDRYTSGVGGLPTDTRFNAEAGGRINLVGTGGFTGQFGSASFTRPDGTRVDVNIAGSTMHGAFYGPAAQEIGGGFHIAGGTPDERIDVVGGFAGKQ